MEELDFIEKSEDTYILEILWKSYRMLLELITIEYLIG